ncbi:MAG: electron transfer flavoprotein subunit alpha/FixB family protein [Deltaproteobacteria bacterium]|nr:electron transfer flavoprotein subunit alpha/FixB family protein [Deltaproteobacteria bacterium]
MTSNKEIIFYAELSDGGLHRNAMELAALARSLADQLGGSAAAILIVGSNSEGLSRELIAYGADRVYVAEDPVFEQYQPEAYCLVIEQVCGDSVPEVLLFGHSLKGADLAPRLSWRLKAGLATDGVEFMVEDGKVSVVRAVYGSKGLSVMVNNSSPCIATVRSKAVSPAERDETRTGDIQKVPVDIDPGALRIKTIERVQEEAEGPKLEEAEVVVSGGRGLGGQEQFAMLEELAGILGGVVGGSRVAVDNKWLPSSRQVGLTGTMVSPRLYIAVGISGATQHMAGCGSSQYIVAINTDPDAPIFQRAHFGVVGDYKQVLPTMIEMCKSGT